MEEVAAEAVAEEDAVDYVAIGTCRKLSTLELIHRYASKAAVDDRLRYRPIISECIGMMTSGSSITA